MTSVAISLRHNLSAYRFAFGAALFGLAIYLAAVLTDEAVDFSEILAEVHVLTEMHEFDEILIGLLIVGVALLVDLSRNLKRTKNAVASEHRALEHSHARLLARTAELEQANTALRDARDKLVEMERRATVQDMVVSLHHEILNPLTGVLGAIELLKDGGAVAPDRRDVLECAEQAALRIEKLVKGLSDLKRIERVTYAGRTTMIDLTEGSRSPDRPPLKSQRLKNQGRRGQNRAERFTEDSGGTGAETGD